ncbi:MAG: hypothetical protein PGN07_05365 [Aeromicrobium erythreum]
MITGYGDALYAPDGGPLYFWLPIVAPLLGGLVGGALFHWFVDVHLPDDEPEPAPQPTPESRDR